MIQRHTISCQDGLIVDTTTTDGPYYLVAEADEAMEERDRWHAEQWRDREAGRDEQIAELKVKLSASLLREKMLSDKWTKENLDLAVMIVARKAENIRQAEEIDRLRTELGDMEHSTEDMATALRANHAIKQEEVQNGSE